VLVVKYYADVGLGDGFGHDAFMAACCGGHLSIASFLLGRRFLRDGKLRDRDLDEMNKQEISVLHICGGTWACRGCGVSCRAGCKCGEYKIGGHWGIDGERGVVYVWPDTCYSGATWDGTAGTGFYGFPTEVKWVRSSSVHHCLVFPWDFQIMRTFKRIASSPSAGRTIYYEDAHKIITARRCYS